MLVKDLQVVLKVAELSSVRTAATKLGISTPTASNALKRVEKELGVQLFLRTTRSIRLSDAGEKFICKCEEALQLLDQANLQVKSDVGIINGDLKLSVPSDLGRNYITKWVSEFMLCHPELGVRLWLSDSIADFYQNPINAELRYVSDNSIEESNLYGIKICHTPNVLCASPDYIKKSGTPNSPDELCKHNGLLSHLNGTPHDIWMFQKGDQSYKAKMKSTHTANDGDIVKKWCVEGHGIALKSCIDISDELLRGNLVTILPDFKLASTELWLLSPNKPSLNPTITYFGEMLKARCSNIINRLHDTGILS